MQRGEIQNSKWVMLISIPIGFLFNLSFEPFGLWWCCVLAIAVFPLLESLSSSKRFMFGWLSGVFVQAFGYYWIFFTIRDFGGLSPFLSVIGSIGFWLFQGLDLGLWFLFAPLLFKKAPSWLRLVLQAGLLALIQSYLFPYVFPWLVGAVLTNSIAAQSAWIWKSVGLTFWLMLAGLSLGQFFLQRKKPQERNLGLGLIAISALALFGPALVAPEDAAPGRSIKVGCVQPNIIPWAKREPENMADLLKRHVEPTRLFGRGQVDLVVWPETALPLVLKNYPSYVEFLQALVEDQQVGLLLGCLGSESGRLTNEVWLFAPDTAPQIYQKEKLVMFSESLPWPFGWASYFVKGIGHFRKGQENRPFLFRGIKIQPLICYEAIFPHFVGQFDADLYINVTNDAWFGKTKASRLHLQHLQMRPIENSAPLVRCANSGISCWVDKKGAIHDSTPIYEAAAPTFNINLAN